MRIIINYLFLVSFGYGVNGLPANNPVRQPWIWPLPQTWQRGEATVEMSESIQFNYDSRSSILTNGVQRYQKLIFLKEVYPMIPYNWSTTAALVTSILNTINIQVEDVSERLDMETDESYSLIIPATDCGDVTIKAKTVFGALHAMETLSQIVQRSPNHDAFLIPNAPWNIVDYPTYKHRGLLLDTSRHYYDVNDIYKVIDTMSWNKMNILHWHFLDATSFPYVSKAYPQLAEKGAYSPRHQYTAGDIRQLIQYAKERGVRVMPEVEAPGHSTSWAYGSYIST